MRMSIPTRPAFIPKIDLEAHDVKTTVFDTARKLVAKSRWTNTQDAGIIYTFPAYDENQDEYQEVDF